MFINKHILVIHSLNNIFMIYIQLDFIKSFFEYKCDKIIILITTTIYWMIISYLVIRVNIGMLNLIVNICMMSILLLLAYGNLKNKIMVVVYMTLVGMISELISLYIISSIDGLNLSQAISIAKEFLLIDIISNIIMLFVFKITSLIIYWQRNQYISNSYWIALLIVPFGSILLLISIMLIMLKYDMEENSLLLISIIFILLINIIVFYIYGKLLDEQETKLENQLLSKEVEYYISQNEIQEKNYEKIKELKHNLKNNLICIKELIDEDKLNQSKDQINHLLGEISNIEKYSNSGNVAIDSIINYKFNYAKEYKIDLFSEVEIPSNLNLDISDISVLLGNLLDNSIEACKKVREGQKSISIEIFYTKGNLLIKCENNFIGEIEYNSKGEIITTKKDNKNNGIGLKSIKRIVSKYNGEMTINIKDNTFIISILLFNIIC